MAPEAPETSGRVSTGDDLSDVLREYMNVTGRVQRTHQALRQEVTRLREELANKDRELEVRRRLAALGEMAAGVAHEVRNPLGAIQLYSGLLRNQCNEHGLGPALRLIEKIEAGIQAIEAVVQDTLALVPRDRRPVICRLEEVVARARDATAKALTVCQVNLEIRFAEPDLCVCADPDGLQRVLVNLLVNAAEASGPGRVVRLDVARAAGDEVELRVADEGGGLPEEIRHRIFDPFFTTKQNGTGLGLTIAHRLTEAYGGRLSAGNRPTGGAEFVIALPRGPVAEGPEAEKQQYGAA